MKRRNQRKCTLKGCNRPHYGLGYCQRHYQRYRSTGSPHLSDKPHLTVLERLKANIVKMPNGCWLWTGPSKNGYGVLPVRGKSELVHRLMWKHYVDEAGIPDDMVYRHDPTGEHKCIKRCVNVNHGTIGTQKENMNDHDRTGQRHHNARNTDKQVARAIAVYADNPHFSYARIGRMFGVSDVTARNWIKGATRASTRRL